MCTSIRHQAVTLAPVGMLCASELFTRHCAMAAAAVFKVPPVYYSCSCIFTF